MVAGEIWLIHREVAGISLPVIGTMYASADGVTWAALTPTVTTSGGDSWSRYDYAVTAPTGTNYLRVTFLNSGANAWTPQIGQMTYSAAVPTGTSTPAATQTLAATPTSRNTPTATPSPTTTPRNTPTASPSPTATPRNTPTATPSPTTTPRNTATATPAPSPPPSASPTAAPVHVTVMHGGDGASQESQYRVRLYNDNGSAQDGLKARIYRDLSAVFAAGRTARDVAIAKYWDQCNAVQIGPATVGDGARSLYSRSPGRGTRSPQAASVRCSSAFTSRGGSRSGMPRTIHRRGGSQRAAT